MPAHESLHEYYLHQHRNIENYLELCMIHAETELVHELRLSIKKLRAFHKLAGELCPAKTEEHIHAKNRVRRLFRIAGQLRDTQVQIHLLVLQREQTGTEYPEFGKWLLKREKKRIRRFGSKPIQVLPHATADAAIRKLSDCIAGVGDKAILDGAAKVLANLCKTTKKLSARKRNERDLHTIRTLAKQVKYILNILHHTYPDFKFNDIPVENIHNVEVSVGHWHDKLVRVQMLEKFMAKSRFADDSLLLKYQKLLDTFKAELDLAYNEAYRVVRSELLSEQPGSTK